MKKQQKNNDWAAWDAFVEFLENIFYPGVLINLPPEEVKFRWEDFVKYYGQWH